MTARTTHQQPARADDEVAVARPKPTTDARRIEDARFDDEMSRTMTEAAELRAERARIRAAEDERSYRDEAAAILDLVRQRRNRAGDPR